MGNYWWCAILFRILLPCAIAVAFYARPTITSYIYLLMGLYLPFFSVPTHRTMIGSTGTYLKILIIVSMLVSSMVVSFYFALFFPGGNDYEMVPCGPLEQILRTVGVIEYRKLPLTDACSWIIPEPLMLGTSTIMFVLLRKLTRPKSDREQIRRNYDSEDDDIMMRELSRRKLVAMFLNLGKYLLVLISCVTAVIRPSIIGVVYYLIFLVVMTYWACNKTLGKVYARILVILSPVLVCHMTILFFYQMQYFQDNKDIGPETIYGRLFQLVRMHTYKDCSDPRLLQLHEHSMPTYVFPFILFVFYNLTILVSREILQAKDGVGGVFVAFFKCYRVIDLNSRWKMAFLKVKEQLKEQKLQAIDEKLLADRVRGVLNQAIQFNIRISYLLANFMMMIWAITYIGWKTLVLLMWANLTWLLPARRKIMLATSPFLVAYVWFLLGTSYIYSMDINIPGKFGIWDLASGSHDAEEFMWIHLTIKSLFSVIIFVTMRQFFQERAMKREQRNLAEAMGVSTPEASIDFDLSPPRSKTWIKIEYIFRKWFSLCWIWVVLITMIWMDFMSTSNPFRITFVALAILLIMTFQIFPFNCWKKFLFFYWWIVIIYAMVNLFILYMYQLRLTRLFLHNYVTNSEGFKKIGFDFEQDTKRRLFVLGNPLFLQIAIVIQKNYFQPDFDKYTSPVSLEETESQEKELDEIDPRVRKIIDQGCYIKNLVFTLLEIHLQKIILFLGWLVCCYDFCAFFFPFVILLTASCVFGRLFTWFTIHLMSLFVQILILARLVYMNQYNNHHLWNFVGHYQRNGKYYNVTLNTADWLGLHRSKDSNQADFWLLAWCFLFLFIVTLDPVVRLRQLNYKKSRNLSIARQRVLFPEVTMANCHDNIKNMLKFFVNYGFYKLGIEISLVMAVMVMAIRMDSMSVIISIGLLLTYSLSRKWTKRVLMPIMLLTGIWLPFEYFMSLGFWPTYWEHSKTTFWNDNDFKIRIQQFCHIMNMAHPPPKEKIVYDFLFLMCLSRQWRMFRVMKKFKEQEFGAGDNENVANLIDSEDVNNPVPDFVTYSRNFLDIYKKIFFPSWFYLSLLVIFLAGTERPAIYSFGYILAAFLIMWEGDDMFLRPPTKIISRWNVLIFYNLCILAFRTWSQLFGCILVYEWQDINCKIYTFNTTLEIPNMNHHSPCKVVKFDPVGLQWDCVAFFFLIMQQRIFKSFHFFHLVNDAKAQKILGDRGAQLIEEQRQKKKQSYDNQDSFIRTNVSKKIKTLQDNRLKIQGEVYLRRKKNHKHMLRSGDYYLFDEVERNLNIPLFPPKEEEQDSEYDPYDPMPLDEFMSCFLKSNLSGVLEEIALRKRQKQAVLEGKKPENLKKAVVLKEPRPGRSTDPDATLASEKQMIITTMHIVLFLWGLIESIIVTLTALINRMTKDFRYILTGMEKDKVHLKENANYTQGYRVGTNKIWKPSQPYSEYLKAFKGKKVENAPIHYSIYEKLLRSIWHLGIAQSEWLCYLVIVMNQVTRAHFISLPLPLMVFCWGSLTVPKPTKTFWVIMIAHALIMSIIKNFFVMDLADWNEHTFPGNFFYPPSVIGIDRYINTFMNLSLLCSLFFHSFFDLKGVRGTKLLDLSFRHFDGSRCGDIFERGAYGQWRPLFQVVLQWLGLWEPIVYRTASLINDGEYKFGRGKFIPLVKQEDRTKDTLNVVSSEISMGDYFPRSIQHGAGKYAEGFRLFIQQLISPASTQIPVDVYTQMFLCDLLNLLLIVFCYSFFENVESEDSSQMGFIQYLQDNRVPVTYIGAIVGYCFMIVIDRWIYLRRNRFAKLVYHYFQVMTVHIWAFVLYPMMTGRVLTETFVVQLFYVSKCVYFLFSAYQIRNGYPQLISAHFLTHGTGFCNRYGFKLYRMIPYLFEMRTLLDWTCSDTSLNVTDFFKMEEINQCIFDQKCQQDFEALMTDSGGKRINRTFKYCVGGMLFATLFLTIIFPFLIFSLGRSVGVKTHPTKMYLEVYMGSAEPIFKSYASQKNLFSLKQEEFQNLTQTFNNIRSSEGLFGAFDYEDVVVVKWSTHSLSSWLISPGSLRQLIEEVESPKPFTVRVVIRYTHKGSGQEKSDRVFGQNTHIPPLPNPAREDLLNMLRNGSSNKVVWLPLVYPKFMMITKEAKPRALAIMEEPKEERYTDQMDDSLDIEELDDDDDDEVRDPKRLRNLLLSLQKEEGKFWWQIKEECDPEDDNYIYYLSDLVYNSCDDLIMYTFNEKVFSGTMHYVTESGIMGLYFIYFMVVFGVIRSMMIDVSEIWIEDLPNSDRLMRKCKEVYVARDMLNYELEEELFAELVFIMRSREICIKLTRYDDDPYNPTFITPGTRRTKS